MRRDDSRALLQHIRESIELIAAYTRHMRLDEFLANPQIQDAVIRRLEVIGEATKHLPAKLTSAHPEAPWREIAGMRDLLIHRYFAVDLRLTWRVVVDRLPELDDTLARILRQLPDE